MSDTLVVTSDDQAVAAELRRELGAAGVEIDAAPGETAGPFRGRGAISFAEIAITLGSAGAFSGLMRTIAAVLSRNRGRRVSLKRRGVEVVVEGHSIPEERELLERLFPELMKK